MNRYHIGLIFAVIALILCTSVSLKNSYLTKKAEAEQQTEQVLNFAVSSAIGKLNHSFGSANDYYTLSDTFFKSLALMEEGTSVLEGRISAEDFHPYVPVFICLEERYYHLGNYTSSGYQWTGPYYYPEYKTLSACKPEEVILLVEDEVNSLLQTYHDKRNLPHYQFIFPGYASRNLTTPMILVVLENFPTILNGYYYSGAYSGDGALIPIITPEP